MNVELHRELMGRWLDGLKMPLLDDPLRRLEELRLNQLRTFFALLLASEPHNPPRTPWGALQQLAPGLQNAAQYEAALQLPLRGSPDDVAGVLEPGDPDSEIFALQERLTDQLSDDGRLVLHSLAQLY